MAEINISCLQDCLTRYESTIPELADTKQKLTCCITQANTGDLGPLIKIYDSVYPILENAMWLGNTDFHSTLLSYQSLFREQEALIQQQTNDDRYEFILSIPTADRPPHLHACLESIYQLCTLYGYGGKSGDYFDKIRVIVAEDSRDQKNIQRHLEIIEAFRQKGLNVIHLDQSEQYELLQAIPEHLRKHLGTILTTQPKDRFYLKGQAANRNLSYLKFLQLTKNKTRTLYYLVDSDQSFCINRQTSQDEEVVYALNYFYTINKVFSSTNTLMLTGKLVGDPPVSPSVMTSNFLDDVTAFFTDISKDSPTKDCHFHNFPKQIADDAAYHDMANLFGFKTSYSPFTYRCPLDGKHDHTDCLIQFASKLNAFFFGEHLTRKTIFSYGKGLNELSPARTIYPGNYIVNYEGLKYIIPFGHLRLRMSGPTAGRLIQAEIHERFASINLPMFHRRTSDDLHNDFRPGVELEQENIDLSNESERQFFGDLMLFSVVELVAQSDVNQPFNHEVLIPIIEHKETELLKLYRQKNEEVRDKTKELNSLVFESCHWWLQEPRLASALQHIKAFIRNIEYNFGENSLAYQQINSPEHRTMRKQQIIDALMNYRHERNAWDQLF